MTKQEYLRRLNRVADALNSAKIELAFLLEDYDELPTIENKISISTLVNIEKMLNRELQEAIDNA